MAAMADTVAREKPNHTMAMLRDMEAMVDMGVTVDTVPREKPKFSQLHIMADMAVTVDSVMLNQSPIMEAIIMPLSEWDTADLDTTVYIDTAIKPTVINLYSKIIATPFNHESLNNMQKIGFKQL